MADDGWRMTKCAWKKAHGKMRMEKCAWKNEDGKVSTEKWKNEDETLRMENCE